MKPIAVVLNRFMRLLPFLTAPNSYRRFQFEYFIPCPDVWDAPGGKARAQNRDAHPYLSPASLQHVHPDRQEPFW